MNNNSYKAKFEARLVRFSLDAISFCAELRGNKDFYALADQLVRSGTSIGANIVEAKSCGTRKDYLRFFEIALRSANETKYWLILVRESPQSNKSDKEIADKLMAEATEIAKIIAAGVITMKSKARKAVSANFLL